MIEQIFRNIEWIFSGIGVALIGGVIGICKKKKNKRKTKEINQIIYKGSNNNQAGGDINVNK